jgi:hypothetical protein
VRGAPVSPGRLHAKYNKTFRPRITLPPFHDPEGE